MFSSQYWIYQTFWVPAHFNKLEIANWYFFWHKQQLVKIMYFEYMYKQKNKSLALSQQINFFL